MTEKEDRLGLLKFAIQECGDFKLSMIVKDNVITDMCTSDGNSTLHEIGFHKAFWCTW